MRATLLRAPGQHGERDRVGHGDHVRLLDGVEAGYRRAVEAHASLERVLELLRVDREALQLAEDVREPQANEADVAVLDERLDVGSGLRLFGLMARRLQPGVGPALERARTAGSRASPFAVRSARP